MLKIIHDDRKINYLTYDTKKVACSVYTSSYLSVLIVIILFIILIYFFNLFRSNAYCVLIFIMLISFNLLKLLLFYFIINLLIKNY